MTCLTMQKNNEGEGKENCILTKDIIWSIYTPCYQSTSFLPFPLIAFLQGKARHILVLTHVFHKNLVVYWEEKSNKNITFKRPNQNWVRDPYGYFSGFHKNFIVLCFLKMSNLKFYHMSLSCGVLVSNL